MAQVKIELQPQSPAEEAFVKALKTIAFTASARDCRDLRDLVKMAAEHTEVDMVIGCGGSHIWIHRATEYKQGEHTHPENQRFAIITD